MGGTNLLVQQLATSGATVTAINSGAGGNQAADIEADIAGRITNYNPTHVVLYVGINDMRGVPGAVSLDSFRASYDHILSQTKSTLPNVKIICVGLPWLFELWSTSPPNPHFAGNPFDTGAGSIDMYNLQIRGSAVAHGCAYVDTRGPAALAEAVQNAPAPGVASGILAGDGLHPTAAGQLVISTAVRGVFTI